MIKNFEPRLYQETIFASCTRKNTLVVLPTGMGKTNIFLMLAAHRMQLFPNFKVLFIGPTRPLIDQYLNVFKEHFDIKEEEMCVLTGMISPEKRAELWKSSKVIFSTPQGLENDIVSNRIDLGEVCLLGIDEAHRAVGDYSYVFVAKQYHKKAQYPRLLALTASPGSDMEKIKEVCKNLFIEEIEIRTDNDPDVKPYVQDIELDWIGVDLPVVFKEIQRYLSDIIKDRTKKLKDWGILQRKNINFVSKTDLLSLQAELRGRAASGHKDFVLWNAISVCAEIMKISHGLGLLETQGIDALYKYLENLNKEGLSSKTKAAKNIVKDINFRSALIKTEKLYNEKVQHPKLIKLLEIIEEEIKKNPKARFMVFNQYRENALNIVKELGEIKGINAELFVGQTKKGETGLSQKEQKEVIEKFRNGEFNVIVATSVGEEGIDIPKVPFVIFYEPIPSAIRHIQRKGRTGRQEAGKVMVLMAKNTRDVAYRWTAHHKEKRMYRNLDSLKKKLGFNVYDPGQQTIEKFKVSDKKVVKKKVEEKKGFKIIVDHREKASKAVKDLVDKDFEIKVEKLEYADFVLSDRCGVELKTKEDFVSSILDGRLLEQIKHLKNNYQRPVIIVEGEEDIYSVRNVHPNAIQGMLATIAVSYGLPLLYTKNSAETASLLGVIAKREQEETGKDFTPHASLKPKTIKEQQEYIVSSLPGIGAGLGKDLLKKFKTIKKIVNAKKERLEKVDKVGDKKADEIRRVLDEEYRDEN